MAGPMSPDWISIGDSWTGLLELGVKNVWLGAFRFDSASEDERSPLAAEIDPIDC